MIEANEYHGERHPSHEVFKGRLASTHGKVVIITKPDADGRILIVFKCAKVAGCSKFRVDLEVNPLDQIISNIYVASQCTTFQFIINAKLSKQSFWPWLIRMIAIIPQSQQGSQQ